MKKVIILVALAVVALSSCSKNESGDNNQELVPVRMCRSVVTSRAPVATADTYTTQVIASVVSDDYTSFYADKLGTAFNLPVTFTNGDGAFDAGKTVYYPANGSNIFIRGYYPVSGTVVGTVVTHDITGEQDVMISGQQAANRKSVNVPLQFNHLLSKITFKVLGDDAAIAAWGNVTKVEVLNQTSKVDMDVNKPVLAEVLTANAAPTTTAFTAYSDATGQQLTNSAALLGSAGSPVMVLPTTEQWTIKVYTTLNEAGVEISSEDNLAINAANEITLTFIATDVKLTATVVDWATGAAIDADVK